MRKEPIHEKRKNRKTQGGLAGGGVLLLMLANLSCGFSLHTEPLSWATPDISFPVSFSWCQRCLSRPLCVQPRKRHAPSSPRPSRSQFLGGPAIGTFSGVRGTGQAATAGSRINGFAFFGSTTVSDLIFD